MSEKPEKVKAFEEEILLPALREISAAPALLKEYTVEVVAERPSADEAAEQMLGDLAGAMRRDAGPSLVIANRSVPDGLSRLAGRYLMTVFYEPDEGQVAASPAVLFWMRFNNKLHVFNHRYDNEIAFHYVEDVTRQHIFNHVLRSFDFYKLYALSEKPFPGYR